MASGADHALFRALAALLVLTTVGCGSRAGTVGTAELYLEPSQLDFGTVFLGHPQTRTFSVHSGSRTRADVKVLAPDGLRVTPEHATVEAGGRVEFQVVWNPTAEAQLQTAIILTTPEAPLAVSVRGHARAIPDCGPQSACSSSAFNPSTGQCETTPRADGTACTLSNACFEGGACMKGVCVGTSKRCDDADACTTDACDALSGCVHLQKSCPEPTDPCLAAACDPVLGCQAVPVADGTACGENDCRTAKVCLAGACTTVTPPEGSVCRVATPCQGAGVCQAQACTAPAKTALKEVFSREVAGATKSAGALRPLRDAQGNLYWLEQTVNITAQGDSTQTTLISTTRDGFQRFKTVVSAGWQPSSGLLVGPRVVVEMNKQLFFVAAASGALEGSLSLQQQLGLQQQGAQWMGTDQVLADGAGRLKVIGRKRSSGESAPGGAPMPPPPVCGPCEDVQHTVVATVDPATRQATKWVSLRDGFQRAVVDAQDNLYLGFGVPKAVISLSSAGVERWNSSQPTTSDPGPLSVNHGALVLDDGRMLSTVTGQLVSVMTPRPSGPSAISGDGYHAWVGEHVIDPSADHRLYFFKGAAPGPSASAIISRLSYSELALATEATGLNGETELTLVAGTEFNWDSLDTPNRDAESPGALPPATWVLRAVDARGAVRWACPIPGTDDDSSRTFKLSAVSLGNGRWSVQQDSTCTTCLKPPATTLRTFEVGPLKAATRGWVGTGGSPGRTGRPLP